MNTYFMRTLCLTTIAGLALVSAAPSAAAVHDPPLTFVAAGVLRATTTGNIQCISVAPAVATLVRSGEDANGNTRWTLAVEITTPCGVAVEKCAGVQSLGTISGGCLLGGSFVITDLDFDPHPAFHPRIGTASFSLELYANGIEDPHPAVSIGGGVNQMTAQGSFSGLGADLPPAVHIGVAA